MILVTGASGFVGGHVARALVKAGASVRVLLRNTSLTESLQNLKAERCYGDLRDPSALRFAVAGCKQVFHVAADYRLWVPNPQAMYAANVDGTANLLDAAAEAGVERIVYTSTVGCMGWPRDGSPANEETPVSVEDMTGHYKRSKFLAEQAALERARRGVPIVIVNPTAPVGEGDWKPTPTGKIILDFMHGQMPAYLDTGLNLVDVHSVAAGHLAAAERGRIGQRYLLGDRNMRFREILEVLGKLSGRRPPRLRIPWVAAYAAALGEHALFRLTGREPRAPLEAVRLARHKMFIASDKAQRELGYQPGNVEEALERAVRYFGVSF
jgi:dihydroflavonol-4-reductase